MKYFDIHKSISSIAEGDTWAATEQDPNTLDTLFVPTEGPGINQRIGRKVKVYKIKIRGVIESSALNNSSDPVPSPAVRILLVQDMQTNSVQAQGEDVMATPTVSTTQLAFCQFQNINNFGRFKVLKDKVYQGKTPYAFVDGVNTAGIAIATTPFKFTINFPTPVVVRFNATNGGTVADIIDHSWHIYALKETVDFVTSMTYQARICFKE